MKISFRFCFRGLWLGAYHNPRTRALHVCLIPFITMIFQRRPAECEHGFRGVKGPTHFNCQCTDEATPGIEGLRIKLRQLKRRNEEMRDHWQDLASAARMVQLLDVAVRRQMIVIKAERGLPTFEINRDWADELLNRSKAFGAVVFDEFDASLWNPSPPESPPESLEQSPNENVYTGSAI